MTTIIAIKKGDEICMGCDGMQTRGDEICNHNAVKIFKHKNYIVGFSGCAIIGELFEYNISNTKTKFNFNINKKADAYKFFLHLLSIVKLHNQCVGKSNSDELEGLGGRILLATTDGLYEIDSFGSVSFKDNGIVSIGSGQYHAESYATGKWYSGDDIQDIIEQSILYSATKVNTCGGQITLYSNTN